MYTETLYTERCGAISPIAVVHATKLSGDPLSLTWTLLGSQFTNALWQFAEGHVELFQNVISGTTIVYCVTISRMDVITFTL